MNVKIFKSYREPWVIHITYSVHKNQECNAYLSQTLNMIILHQIASPGD